MTDPDFFTGEQLIRLMRKYFRLTQAESESAPEGHIILPAKIKNDEKS